MREFAIELARGAGKILREHCGKIQKVEQKTNMLNLVTEVDLKSERYIIGEIEKKFPDHDTLAEEPSNTQQDSDYRWIIDPLDGTTNYAHSYPFFCVSIALEAKKEIVIGVVYNPMLDELFLAERGKGAFLNQQSIQVSSTDKLERSLLVTGFAYDLQSNPNNNIDHFTNFLHRSQAVRRDGSAAIDLCYVASGRFDGFWEMGLKRWDVAAGGLIVQEAGGQVTDFTGSPDWTDGNRIVASNQKIHKQILDILKLSPHYAG